MVEPAVLLVWDAGRFITSQTIIGDGAVAARCALQAVQFDASFDFLAAG
jgi:hypothetical protein